MEEDSPATLPPTALVLAGGRSTRLGRDKALEPVGGVPVLARVLHVLARLTGDIVLVEAPGAQRELPDLDVALRRTVDDTPGAGPLAGLAAGLRASRSAHAWAVACDLPFLHQGLLLRLMGAAPGWEAVVPVWQGRPQPLCAVYSRACLAAAERLLAGPDRSLRALLAACSTRYLSEEEVRAAGAGPAAFLDVNTAARLAEAERLAAAPAAAG